MRIKEVEKRVGIPSKNIRYYEEAGLISPGRNQENNYREYSERDIIILEQIKVLRVLGISIADIKEIENGNLSLEKAVQELLAEYYGQKDKLLDNIEVCEKILRDHCSIDELDEQIFDAQKPVWRERIKKVFAEDITKEVVSDNQLKWIVCGMLSYGLFLCFLVSMLCGNTFLHEIASKKIYFLSTPIWAQEPGFLTNNYLIIGLCIFVFASVVQYFTSNIVILLVLFHIVSILTAPFVGGIVREIMGMPGLSPEKVIMYFQSASYSLNWFLLIGFAFLLVLISKNGIKRKLMVISVFGYTGVMTIVFGTLFHAWMATFFFFILSTTYLSLCWYGCLLDMEGKSKYYAMIQGMSIMNFVGIAFARAGKARFHISA